VRLAGPVLAVDAVGRVRQLGNRASVTCAIDGLKNNPLDPSVPSAHRYSVALGRQGPAVVIVKRGWGNDAAITGSVQRIAHGVAGFAPPVSPGAHQAPWTPGTQRSIARIQCRVSPRAGSDSGCRQRPKLDRSIGPGATRREESSQSTAVRRSQAGPRISQLG
jgi:hypothetical protein